MASRKAQEAAREICRQYRVVRSIERGGRGGRRGRRGKRLRPQRDGPAVPLGLDPEDRKASWAGRHDGAV